MRAALLASLLIVGVLGSSGPLIESLSPTKGYRRGGFRLHIKGRNLGFLPDQPVVLVAGAPCTEVSVDRPWHEISCKAPACLGCIKEDVIVSVSGRVSPPVPLEFTGLCEGAPLIPDRPRPKLPDPYSRAENCTSASCARRGCHTGVPSLATLAPLCPAFLRARAQSAACS